MIHAFLKNDGHMILAGIGWIIVVLIAGCAGHFAAPDQAKPWHLQSSGAYNTKDGRVFFGIGKAAPLQNRTLQRVSADNQARLEMARLLDRYSTALSRTASPVAAGAADTPEELEPALKALVHQAMQRAIVTDHWADPNQGRLFALCHLNLVDFEVALSKNRGFHAAMRAAMLSNLEVVHAQLSQGLGENQ